MKPKFTCERLDEHVTLITPDSKKWNAYLYVRVSWKRETHTRVFNLKNYTDMSAALNAAYRWIDTMHVRLNKPRRRKELGVTKPTNTEVKGITKRRVKCGAECKKKHDYLMVTYRKKRTGVSIGKYGLERAMQIAKQKYYEFRQTHA